MEKLVVVCSKNKAKNVAVTKVLENYFERFEIKSVETDSGVSETPVGDEEGIEGCLNRINGALSQISDGVLYIAMEGILTETKYGTFLCGWSVIYNKEDDEYYYGCSAKVKIPESIMFNFSKESRLSDIVGEYIGESELKISNFGTNGMLTNGVYTRTDEFVDSLKCAISTKFKPIK